MFFFGRDLRLLFGIFSVWRQPPLLFSLSEMDGNEKERKGGGDLKQMRFEGTSLTSGA